MTNSETILRRLLWLRHGCPTSALYADDNEMQCGQCKIDFKRDSAEEIQKRFLNIAEQQLERVSQLKSMEEILQLIDRFQKEAMEASSCMAQNALNVGNVKGNDSVENIMKGLAAGQKSERLWSMIAVLRWLVCLQEDPTDTSFVSKLYESLEHKF